MGQRSCYFRIIALALITCLSIDASSAIRLFQLGHYGHGFLGAPSRNALLRQNNVKELWFDQKLDHFDMQSKAIWKQRYYINDEHYRNDSTAPIFLMIGGEGEATKRWMTEGAWIRYAEHFGAYCFQVEHRFYGKSRPIDDMSTNNLQYLSSKQALADLANFIKAMSAQHGFKTNQKWIAFGGSYPGSLASWLGEKYPQLVHGSISSSGPLQAKVDFTEYFDVVTASLSAYKPECVTAVQKSFDQTEILMKHRIGQQHLDEIFKTCTPIKDSVDNPLDVQSFYENLASNFAGVVQYNKDNSPHATVTIDNVCDIMLNETLGTPVRRLAAVNDLLLSKESSKNCTDYKYDNMIKEMKNSTWDLTGNANMRQWFYQTCNEFGFYQTSESAKSTFGNRFNVDFFIKQCMDIFSEKMDAMYLQKAVENTNSYYGALQPNTTNVLYVHGSIDPWHALGLISSKDANMPTIYIEGTAHCANMYEPNAEDFPQLKEARNKIIKFLAKILTSYQAIEIKPQRKAQKYYKN